MSLSPENCPGGGGLLGMYIVRVILIPGFNFRPKGGGGGVGGGVPRRFPRKPYFFRSKLFFRGLSTHKQSFCTPFCPSLYNWVQLCPRRVRWIPNPGSTLVAESFLERESGIMTPVEAKNVIENSRPAAEHCISTTDYWQSENECYRGEAS